MTNIESGQSPMTKCHCNLPVTHRVSRRSHSYGRSFSSCYYHWEDPRYCRFFSWDPPDFPRDEPGAQAPVKQYQTTAEHMLAPTPSTSPYQVKAPMISPSAEKRPASSSTEDVLQVTSGSRKRACTGPDSPSREYRRPSPPPLENPATSQSEFRPVRPVTSEEVIQDVLDALPALATYVRELKRQNSTLQETNQMMETRIQQLEKHMWETHGETEKWRGCD